MFHPLVTELGHDGSIDVDRDQLGISNFESVGHYGYQIGPIVESGIEEEDDDEDSIAMEDSAIEDGDKDDNTAGKTDSDPFWMKTCYICSLTLCVCPTHAHFYLHSGSTLYKNV